MFLILFDDVVFLFVNHSARSIFKRSDRLPGSKASIESFEFTNKGQQVEHIFILLRLASPDVQLLMRWLTTAR